jgi:hypothetical protein
MGRQAWRGASTGSGRAVAWAGCVVVRVYVYAVARRCWRAACAQTTECLYKQTSAKALVRKDAGGGVRPGGYALRSMKVRRPLRPLH